MGIFLATCSAGILGGLVGHVLRDRGPVAMGLGTQCSSGTGPCVEEVVLQEEEHWEHDLHRTDKQLEDASSLFMPSPSRPATIGEQPPPRWDTCPATRTIVSTSQSANCISNTTRAQPSQTKHRNSPKTPNSPQKSPKHSHTQPPHSPHSQTPAHHKA